MRIALVVHFARGLERQTIRRNAQCNLGTRSMVDANERSLSSVAATPHAVMAS